MTDPTPTSTAKRLPRALTSDELTVLLDVPRQTRDRALIRVMAGCGLRVSEACNLRMEDILWTDTPALRFIGKRGRERVVPMNDEVQDALRTWLEVRGANGSPYVFCTLKKHTRLSRKTVWFTLRGYARKAGLRHIHPHMLRHTFGTALADEGIPIERIRDLMGHRNLSSSLIYIQVSAAQKRVAVEKIDRRPWILRWVSRQRNRTFRFFTGLRPRPFGGRLQTVGRRAELHWLRENLSRGIDTLVIGPVGSGKSHLLALLEGEKVLRLPSLSPAKQSIIALAEELHRRGILKVDLPKEGEEVRDDLVDDSAEETEAESGGEGDPSSAPVTDFETLRKRHTRTTVRGWVQMILEAVEEDDRRQGMDRGPGTGDRDPRLPSPVSGLPSWTLIIDDLSDLSASTGRLIDHLNKRFVIFAAAVEIKKPHEKHFWKLERVEVGNLSRGEAVELIRQAASGADIEDYRLFETHVLQKSAGNPRAILEIVDRLRKEPTITRAAIRDVAHVGARGKLDLTPALVLLFAVFVVFRFIARGVDSFDGYMLAGIGSTAFMMLRFFLGRLKR